MSGAGEGATGPGGTVPGAMRSLAIGWGLYAGFTMLLGCSGLLFVAMGALVTVLPDQSGQPAPIWVGGLFGTIGLMFTGIIWLISLPTLIGAWGLYRGAPWAKLLILLLAVSHFFSMPVGTALALWTLHALYTGGMDLDFTWMWKGPSRADQKGWRSETENQTSPSTLISASQEPPRG